MVHRWLRGAVVVMAACLPVGMPAALALAGVADRPPNVVIIFTDDQGYADVGVFGAKGFTTPNIDRMAAQGRVFRRWYAAQAVCTASRTALLTGCYPNRLGMHGALGPASRHGIHADETTLAEVCRERGYATGIFGKWHLGDHERFLPTSHGFDEFFGIPYSNDMWPQHPETNAFPPLPIMEGTRRLRSVDERDQRMMTSWLTARAVDFINRHRDEPFFLYVPHPQPHVPLAVSDRFEGTTERGLYGDVIAEIDWSVGEILNAISTNGLDEKTLVIFTSDNGPWLSYGDHAGSAGPLREGKGTVWEGGFREPCVMRWPGTIPGGTVCDTPAMTIDILPTIAELIGASLPEQRIDGISIRPLLVGDASQACPHEAYWMYYHQNELQAVIAGDYKLILPHRYRTLDGRPGGTGGTPVDYHHKDAGVELYDLVKDPGEAHDLAAAMPEKVAELMRHVEQARDELGDRLTDRTGRGGREPGRLTDDEHAALLREHWPDGRPGP